MNTLTKRLALLATGLTLCGASLLAQAPAPAPAQGAQATQTQKAQKKAKKAHRVRKGVAKTSAKATPRRRGTKKHAKPAQQQTQVQATAKS